jgi:plasmid replication initiation protein
MVIRRRQGTGKFRVCDMVVRVGEPGGAGNISGNVQDFTAGMPSDRKSLVIRHNKLIESRYKMTMAERRFVLWNISQISREDTSFKPFEIGVREYFDLIGLKQTSNPYSVVKKMHARLTQRNIGIEYMDNQGRQAFAYYPWFSELLYEDGRIYSLLNVKLVPYLLQLKEQFTTIALEQAMILDGFYTGRVYDLLVQFRSIGKRTLTDAFIRDRFQITDKYKQFRDLRLYVIDPAVKEINEKTDLHIEYDLVKKGRRYTGFDFRIDTSRPTVTLENNREEQDAGTKRLFKRLVRLGVEQETVRKLIAKYSDQRISWHMEEYEKRRKGGLEIQVGWLVEGIRKDYRPQEIRVDRGQEIRAEKAQRRRRILEELDYLDNVRMGLEKSKRLSDLRVIDSLYRELPEKEQLKIETDFAESLEEDFQQEDFARNSWKSLSCTGEMRRFWYEYNPTMFIDIGDIAIAEGHDWRTILNRMSAIRKETAAENDT